MPYKPKCTYKVLMTNAKKSILESHPYLRQTLDLITDK
jgi:hypothetical protein